MLRLAAFFLVVACLLVLVAAPPVIGTVRSPGQFHVNGSAISGNSTLFDGDVVETAGARSVVQLADAQLTLMPASRARIFRDHTVLEAGSETLSAAQSQSVEAVTLHIAPAVKESVVQVEISAPNRVSVAARDGAADVRNSSGVLIASMRSGMALAFEPQAASPSVIRIAGKLESVNGKFYVTDAATNVRYELRGANLASHVGQNVDVTGASITGASVGTGVSQAVQVSTIQQRIGPLHGASGAGASAGGTGAGAGAGAAPAGAAAGVAGGLSSGAIVAIVGGVAVGGAVGGLAATGAFSGTSSASAP